MRSMLLAAALLATAPALAQVEAPGTGRAESNVNSLNRSMMQEQRSREVIQQNQFEVNSLRNELSRPAPPAPPPVVVVPGAR